MWFGCRRITFWLIFPLFVIQIARAALGFSVFGHSTYPVSLVGVQLDKEGPEADNSRVPPVVSFGEGYQGSSGCGGR